MAFTKTREMITLLLCTLLWAGTTQASSRWDVLRWCTEDTQADRGRCEGMISAAVDLRTSDDFSGSKSCFLPSARLSDVRVEVVAWLKDNKVTAEQSGLALTARAIREQFPCSK